MDTSLLRWTLEDKLTKSRVAAGMTQIDIARELGVSTATVNRWETGRIRITKPSLMAWSMVTGVPLEWFDDDGRDSSDTVSATHRYRANVLVAA